MANEMEALLQQAGAVDGDLQLEDVVRQMTERLNSYGVNDHSTDTFKVRIYEVALHHFVAKTMDELAKNPNYEPIMLRKLTALDFGLLRTPEIIAQQTHANDRVKEMQKNYTDAIALTERAFVKLDQRMSAGEEIARINAIFPDDTIPPTDAFRLTGEAVRIEAYRNPDKNIANAFGSVSLETPQQRFHAAGVVLGKTAIKKEERLELFRQILTMRTERDMEMVHKQPFV